MRIYNKWYKELWFWIQENWCEILCVGMMVITLIAIVVAWIYEGKNGI
jgi:hypothetical protein